jgi:hypothetical protein
MVTPTIVDTMSEQVAAPSAPSQPIPNLEEKEYDRAIGSRYTQPGKITTNDK